MTTKTRAISRLMLVAIIFAGAAFAGQAAPASAHVMLADASQTAATSGGLVNPLKAASITELLNILLKALVEVGSILLVLALVWVGFLFVAAQGAEEKIRDARTALMWTVIGGLILLGAEAISQVVSATVQAL